MSYMLYIDGHAAWSATSLPDAQKLARGYIDHGQPLKIVGYEISERHRTWIYDYGRSAWLERAANEPGPRGCRRMLGST